MDLSVADLRQNYTLAELNQSNVEPNAIAQFAIWFEQAVEAQLLEPNAMTLATATPDGKPSARIVLLKGFDHRGFVFYTNYYSHKGRELTANNWAALVFWWGELERQVRIEGRVEKVSAEESDAYFQSRPINSQLGAWASDQSQVIPTRQVLDRKLNDLAQQYQEKPIPRPPHWGGFRVSPEIIEFWQGRPNRLHDRLKYTLQPEGNWKIERLSP
ncbi:Pyridoxamine 5'-phosphate oxidase [Stanieria cyanosphaera PCC 7437]|uniref:Pyridoxine/pyridoxamine 5'-phosphate oxidase n=1 Tax=Stanieria cyanosphaera (strain ATCC 29371 / PCC 7437) TaxID=111780 RepID=K9XRU7_STAC7|nr:pyridoxamine 5'-phosphate oxidase [Stanieria cyanosphaera]AFZ34402.1 Pyridoxamine 5'-phosphate oxidase [Stanieria cyanosphaera PCC 7437]